MNLTENHLRHRELRPNGIHEHHHKLRQVRSLLEQNNLPNLMKMSILTGKDRTGMAGRSATGISGMLALGDDGQKTHQTRTKMKTP